jgi:peptidyl-prolyl cis-trans isomerase SDCCAG10
VGDTIYNVLKLNDYELDDDARPVFPPKIIKTEVVWNPFDDIVPRVLRKRALPEEDNSKIKKRAKIAKK